MGLPRYVYSSFLDIDNILEALADPSWPRLERMLAPRAVHFSRHQIFWDCPRLSACESMPRGIPHQLDHIASIDRHWRGRPLPKQPDSSSGVLDPDTIRSASRENPHEFWKNAVRKYTSCALTFHSDKLKALWGIARLVRDAQDEDFVAGLWSTQLVEQLAWIVVTPDTSQRPSTSPSETNSENLGWFPSWSWASVTGEVDVVDRKWQNRSYLARSHNGQEVAIALGSGQEKVAGGVPEIPKDQASLALQCHRGQGILTNTDDNTGWALRIPGHDQMDLTIQAFPDTLPSHEDRLAPCKFLLLAVEQRPQGMDESGIIRYGTQALKDRRSVYTGVGLLVQDYKEAEKSDHVKRVGALRFSRLNESDWRKVCRACGQESGELVIESGKRLWLD